jgi:hypothetical protein
MSFDQRVRAEQNIFQRGYVSAKRDEWLIRNGEAISSTAARRLLGPDWRLFGWGGRIRTFNLLIQSQLRYRCATPQQVGSGRLF